MPTLTLLKSQKYEKFQGIDIAKYFLNNFSKYNNNDLVKFFVANVKTEEKTYYTPIEFPQNIQSKEDIEMIKEKYNTKLGEDDVCIFLEKFFKALEDYKRDLVACQKMEMFICKKTKTDNYTLYCELSLWYLESFIMEVPYELSFLKFFTFDSLFEEVLNTPEKYYSLISEKYNLKKINFDNLMSVTHDDDGCYHCKENSSSKNNNVINTKEEETESDECESISSSEGEDILDILNEEVYGDEYTRYEEQQEKLNIADELPFKKCIDSNKEIVSCKQNTVYNFWYFVIITFLNLYLINYDRNGFYLLTKENFIKLQYKIMCLINKVSLDVFFSSTGNIIDEIKYYYTKISDKQSKFTPITDTRSNASKFLNKISSLYQKKTTKKVKEIYPLGTIGYYFNEQVKIKHMNNDKNSSVVFIYDRTTHNCLWN